jgi:hypothetical protein
MNSRFLFAALIGIVALGGGLAMLLKASAVASALTDEPTNSRILSIRAVGVIAMIIGLFALVTSPFY